jgi:hypothetical protein
LWNGLQITTFGTRASLLFERIKTPNRSPRRIEMFELELTGDPSVLENKRKENKRRIS